MAEKITNKKEKKTKVENTEITLQHFTVLLEKMSLLNNKLDSIEKEMANAKKNMEKQFKELNEKMDYICDNMSETIYENDSSSDEYDSNDDENMKCNKFSKNNGKKKIILNDGKNIKPKGVIIKFDKNEDGDLNDSTIFNILSKFGGFNDKKEDEKVYDSDEDYDEKFNIRDKSDDVHIEKNYVDLEIKINNINDLIKIGEKYNIVDNDNIDSDDVDSDDEIYDVFNITPKKKKFCKLYNSGGKKFNINLNSVHKLVEPLKNLNRMVGLKNVKEQIFEMIIYYLQGFEDENKNMLHSVIEGPPGVGKTKLGKILAKIFCALNIIPSSKFKYVKATDMIGDHVGATKHMTQNVIDEADGGVLFIDEAYALSTDSTKDPYGKECMDTLNFNLSENKKKLIVIIAGYSDELEKCFFSHNPGLQRRFPFRYKIEKYSGLELSEIFKDKVKKHKWKINNNVTDKYLETFFTKYINDFNNFGGDIENYLKKCQFSHSKRTISMHPLYRGKLTIDDLENGFNNYKKNKKKDENNILNQMYL